ncbi:MAG: GNAT family N-acetyltransferase [Bacilli bacterium]|nr:GNAT family N-acetyltransferase [Bacilli bacterium]
MNNFKFKIIDFSNIKEAIKTQNEIFPNEDGTINLLASLDRNLFMNVTGIFYIDDNVKYYLAYLEDKIVGITGIYSYKDKWPNDAWIGWYGIKEEHRGQGYGKTILEWTITKAKEEGYKTIRLYTDIDDNKKAVKLYEKAGFTGEKYTKEKLDYNCYIYSKSLSEDKVELWDNKLLGLSYQSELDHYNKDDISAILNKYLEILNDKK